jgi:hypothetical protein
MGNLFTLCSGSERNYKEPVLRKERQEQVNGPEGEEKPMLRAMIQPINMGAVKYEERGRARFAM